MKVSADMLGTMVRPARITEPGVVYHLLNRRVLRLKMFRKDADYEAFERVLEDP